MSMIFPKISSLDYVYLHIFWGTGGNDHYVTNQTVNPIDGSSSHTCASFRLVPPSNYQRAWAFSTKDLFVRDGDTGQQLTGVFSMEPISGIITLLTTGSYPNSLVVSYRYYSSFISVKVKDLKTTWGTPPSFQDAFNQNVYPLMKRFPESVEWRLYGADIALPNGFDVIKDYLRNSIKDNNFFLVVDDNICTETFNSSYPANFRPGWAAEGPLFCDDIDLVKRGGDPAILFKLQPHQYGDYYWHTSITPSLSLWPGWPGWSNIKGPSGLWATPPVGYAWPPDDWWDPGTVSASSFVYTFNDLSVSATGPGPALVRLTISHVGSSGVDVDEFDGDYSTDGGATWTPVLSGVGITGSWQGPITIGGYTGSIEFTNKYNHTLNQFWTFTIAAGVVSIPSFNGNSISYTPDAYCGVNDRIYRIKILTGGTTFDLGHTDPGGSFVSGDVTGGTIANPYTHSSLYGLIIHFSGSTYYENSYFYFTVMTNAPSGLPALSCPPGGFLLWRSNLPTP